MEAAFAWLGQIFEALLQFVPRRVIVRHTESGVKWSMWRKPREMKPGFRVWWPLISDIEVIIVARQSFNTPPQPLETRDGREVVAGGVVVFNINDVVQAIGQLNWSPDNTAQDIVQAVIASVISSWDHDELLKEMSDKVEKQLTEKSRKQLRKYGVYVERVGLASFSSTRNQHHSGIEINISTAAE